MNGHVVFSMQFIVNKRVDMRKTLQSRFDKKYIPEPMSGCWLWTGSVNNSGYGQFTMFGRIVGAHRVSYELHNGVIGRDNKDKTLHVLHKCDNPLCVNPDHLFIGTAKDNVTDMISKGRKKFAGRGIFSDMENMYHVEQVALKFGPYLADFAKAIDVPYTTANSWVKRGNIPKWYHDTILRVAESLGIDVQAHELNKPQGRNKEQK